MATLNFPSDPSTQTPVNTYSPDSTPLKSDNGVTYVWDGEKWTANTSGISYLPLSGGTLTGDLTVPSLNGGPLAGFRNALINGNFSIWQRGDDITVPTSGAGVNGAAYTADRWLASQANVRMQAATPSASLPDFGWCAVFTAARTADYIEQPVELVRNGRMEPFLPGTTWTFSFYHDKNLNDFTFGCGFVDTSASLGSGDIVVPDTTAFTSLGNSRYSCTFTIPADQTIASTRKAFVVRIASSRSSVITGARLTGCQLEPGPVATPFEMRPLGTELALCQRYYQRISATSSAPYLRLCEGNMITSNTLRCYVDLKTSMRSVPDFSQVGNQNTAPTVSITPTLSIEANASSTERVTLKDSTTVGGTQGDAISVFANNDSSAFIAFDAEL